MSNDNEKVFRAITQTGGEEQNLTLEEARRQAEIWDEKGYHAWVEHMHDPYWEDVAVVAAPITPYQVVESLGADRAALQDFMLKMFELLDWEYAEQDNGFVVYTTEAK